jgi:hypothetical protein
MMSEALKPRRPLLPEGLTAFDVSDACREGFISFCRGVAQGWTKRDLATWLVGPYARIARLVDAPLMVDDPPPASRTELSRLATNRIGGLLDPAWQDAVTCLEALVEGRGVDYIDEAFALGTLVEAETVDGQAMFVPVHRPRLLLAVRVRSLIVADFLLSPADFAGDVQTCVDCNVILLGEAARRRGHCLDHLMNSDLRPTAEGLRLVEELMPYLPKASS